MVIWAPASVTRAWPSAVIETREEVGDHRRVVGLGGQRRRGDVIEVLGVQREAGGFEDGLLRRRRAGGGEAEGLGAQHPRSGQRPGEDDGGGDRERTTDTRTRSS